MRKYAVVYEWAGSNWSAYAPDVPGCIATGETIEEVQQLMQDGISLMIEEMQKDGLPVPEPATRAGYVEVHIPATVAAES